MAGGGVALTALATWTLWHSLLGAVAGGAPPSATLKDFYLPDQFAYLGIASNVRSGFSGFSEPFTRTGHSIYPGLYYVGLGGVARITGIGVITAWNVVGLLVTWALLAAAGLVAFVMSGRKAALALGPLPVLLGTWQWWTDGSWHSTYGAHAVLWPPAAILLNPGAEPAALTILLAAVAVFAATAGGSVHRHWIGATAAGALVGLLVNVHTYVAILGALGFGAWFLLAAIWELDASRRWSILASTAAGTAVAIAALHPTPLVRLGVLAAAGPIAVLAWSSTRRRAGARLVAFGGGALATAAPMAVRVVADARGSSSFLATRQASAAARDLSLPVGAVLLHSLPLLLLVGAALLAASRGTTTRDRTWSTAIVAFGAASTLLTFNRLLGVNQEPYRFLPYGQLVLAALSVGWLIPPIGRRASVMPRLVVGLVLASTLPTVVQFVRETPGVRTVTPADQRAFDTIAAAADGRLILVDECLPRGIFKATTGARVVAFNVGLALPAREHELDEVQDAFAEEHLLDDDALRRAGIAWFLRRVGCEGPAPDELRARFGEPVLTEIIDEPDDCRVPTSPVLELYAVPARGEGATLRWPRRIDPPRAVGTSFCVLSTGVDDLG